MNSADDHFTRTLARCTYEADPTAERFAAPSVLTPAHVGPADLLAHLDRLVAEVAGACDAFTDLVITRLVRELRDAWLSLSRFPRVLASSSGHWFTSLLGREERLCGVNRWPREGHTYFDLLVRVGIDEADRAAQYGPTAMLTLTRCRARSASNVSHLTGDNGVYPAPEAVAFPVPMFGTRRQAVPGMLTHAVIRGRSVL